MYNLEQSNTLFPIIIMRHPRYAVFIFCLAVILQIASFDAPAADVCDDQKGEAYGLCLAAEAVPCNSETRDNPVCEIMAEEFIILTNMEPPWLDYIETICPCRQEIDQVIYEIKRASIPFEGECRIGQLTENVPVVDSIGIQIIGKLADNTGAVKIGAYAYDDTDPGGGQCEVDASFEPPGHVFTALIISEAERQVCSDAIERMAPSIGINCQKF